MGRRLMVSDKVIAALNLGNPDEYTMLELVETAIRLANWRSK